MSRPEPVITINGQTLTTEQAYALRGALIAIRTELEDDDIEETAAPLDMTPQDWLARLDDALLAFDGPLGEGPVSAGAGLPLVRQPERRLIEGLVSGMEWWGAQEDGVPEQVFEAFYNARCALCWADDGKHGSRMVEIDRKNSEQALEIRTVQDELRQRTKELLDMEEAHGQLGRHLVGAYFYMGEALSQGRDPSLLATHEGLQKIYADVEKRFVVVPRSEWNDAQTAVAGSITALRQAAALLNQHMSGVRAALAHHEDKILAWSLRSMPSPLAELWPTFRDEAIPAPQQHLAKVLESVIDELKEAVGCTDYPPGECTWFSALANKLSNVRALLPAVPAEIAGPVRVEPGTRPAEGPQPVRVELGTTEIERLRRLHELGADPMPTVSELYAQLEAARGAMQAPIPMLLFCPRCLLQHLDMPDPAKDWTNPPHRSHLCARCGHVWRPADVFTEGVISIVTHGKDDGSAMPSVETVKSFPPAATST